MSKTHWKKSFDSPYIGSWDLEDYKDLTLTIDKVVSEKSKGLKENGLFNIIYFKEQGFKPMLLNSTNSKTIRNIAKSPYIDDWSNIRITLYVQVGVKAFGELHDAIRVRKVTAPPKEVLTEDHPKWDTAKGKVVKDNWTISQIRKHYDITENNYKLLKTEK